jgi:hypothetical protein
MLSVEVVAQIVSDNDPNCGRSLKVSRTLSAAINCCKKLYKEKLHQNQQTTLDAVCSLDADLQSEADSFSKKSQASISLVGKFHIKVFLSVFVYLLLLWMVDRRFLGEHISTCNIEING